MVAFGHDESRFPALDSQFEAADIVGECGLDKCCRTLWELQMRAFEWQLDIAERLDKPVVIHCVRAFNELVELRKRHHRTLWVVHGFTGSIQLCRQLLNCNIEVSFGAAILDPRRSKVRETLAAADPARFFLETDDSGADIADVYRTAAELQRSSENQLREAISTHYHTLFGI